MFFVVKPGLNKPNLDPAPPKSDPAPHFVGSQCVLGTPWFQVSS